MSVMLVLALGVASAQDPAASPPAQPAPVPAQQVPVQGYPWPYPWPYGTMPPQQPMVQQPMQPMMPQPVAPVASQPGVAPACLPIRLGTAKEIEKLMNELYGEGRTQIAFVGNAVVCGWR